MAHRHRGVAPAPGMSAFAAPPPGATGGQPPLFPSTGAATGSNQHNVNGRVGAPHTQQPSGTAMAGSGGRSTGSVAGSGEAAKAGIPNVAGGSATARLTSGQAVFPLVSELTSPVAARREAALLDLSKRREDFPELSGVLWHSFGTIAALLQEIAGIYPSLSPPALTATASNRVCNALALLQCVASHPDTRSLFLNAHIPLYLYPFLNTVSKSRPFEYLRLTSLGVIGALVKVDDSEVVNFLLQTEIIPLCLRIMETGSELSKTVATFIVQKILLDEVGLSYICATAERFYAVSTVLSNMVAMLVESPSHRLLKHIARCYLRLADNLRARDALRQCLPEALRDGTFNNLLRDDASTSRWLASLTQQLDLKPVANSESSGGAKLTAGGGGSASAPAPGGH